MPWDTRSVFDKSATGREHSNDTGDESASVSYCAKSLSTISLETGGGRFGVFVQPTRLLNAPHQFYVDEEMVPPSPCYSFPPRLIHLPVILGGVSYGDSDDVTSPSTVSQEKKRKTRAFSSIHDWMHQHKIEIIGSLAIFLGGMIVLIAVLVYLNQSTTRSTVTAMSPPVTTPMIAPVPAPITAPITVPITAPESTPIDAPVPAPIEDIISSPIPEPVSAPVGEPEPAPAAAPVDAGAPVAKDAPAPAPVAPPVQMEPVYASLLDMLVGKGISSQSDLLAEASPQSLAYHWISELDAIEAADDIRTITRFALATLYFATGGRLTSASWTSCSAVPDEDSSSSGSGNTRCVLEGAELICAEADKFVKCDDGKDGATRWLSTAMECTWFGIECDDEGRVEAIRLPYNGLFGYLPGEIGTGLPYMKVLDLHGNGIFGEIPSQIGNLKELVELNLELNNLSAKLPDELWDLESLEYLLLAQNKFSGALPERMGDMPSIRWLSLERNDFVGMIPESFRKLQTLEVASLEFNDLTGTVPDEICDAPSLVDLSTDCLKPKPKVTCGCCTTCCNDKKCKPQ